TSHTIARGHRHHRPTRLAERALIPENKNWSCLAIHSDRDWNHAAAGVLSLHEQGGNVFLTMPEHRDMMRLKIVQAGEPVLRRQANVISPEELRSAEIQQLIAWMRETMRDAPGVGLAAPQVGVSIQLAVIEDRAELQGLIAPEKLAERGRRPVPFHV